MESSHINAVGIWLYSKSTKRYLYLLRNDDTEDLGLITGGAADTEIDLGEGFGENLIATTLALPQNTVSGISAASSANKGQIVYISDETGGATLAFSDGTNWRRLQDRAVIS